MRVRVLGNTSVETDQGDVPALPRLDRKALAALAVDRDRVWSVDHLIEALWEGEPPASAAKNVRNRIARLRAQLGPEIVQTVGNGYRLGRAVELDTERVATGDAAAIDLVALFRGDPFEDVARWPPAIAAAARLAVIRSSLHESAVVQYLEVGDTTRASAAAEAVVAGNPGRERAWILLVTAYQLAGDHREALDAVSRARTAIRESSGLDPGPELRALEAQLFSGQPTSGSRVGLAHFAVDCFIGRQRELHELHTALGFSRLVTIVGLGGAGKTRLAAEYTDSGRQQMPVAFVDLGRVDWSSSSLEATLCRQLSLPGTAPAAALVTWAAATSALLVIDNVEEVASQLRTLLSELLRVSPRLRVVATSRVPLNARGERLLHLGGLSSIEAAELFEARGGSGDQGAVELACDLVGRLPLGIELTAAQSRVISLSVLTSLVAGNLGILDTALLDPERPGLVAMTKWAIEQLTEPPTLTALAEVAGYSTDDSTPLISALGQLVSTSLVAAASGSSARYSVHPVVRSTQVASHHVEGGPFRDHLVAWAASWVPSVGLHQGAQLAAELESLGIAVRWAIEDGDRGAALAIAQTLRVAANEGRLETLDWSLAALEMTGIEREPLFADTCGVAAWYALLANQPLRAHTLCARVLGHQPESVGAGWAHHTLATLEDDPRHDLEALRLGRDLGDPLLALAALSVLTLSSAFSDPARAERYAAESRDLSEAIDQPWATAITAYSVAVSHIATDRSRAAAELQELRSWAEGEGPPLVAVIAAASALPLSDFADPVEAMRSGFEVLRLVVGVGLTSFVPSVAVSLAASLAALGEADKAATFRRLAEDPVLRVGLHLYGERPSSHGSNERNQTVPQLADLLALEPE